VRRHNQDQRTGETRLFEIGKIFLAEGGPLPAELAALGLIDDRGFQALAEAVLRLAEALELSGAYLKLAPPGKGAPEFLLPGQACRVLRVREMPGHERAEDAIGWLGTISPALQAAFDLRKPVAMCELDLAALASLPGAPRRYAPLPAFPEIVRDVALVVDEQVPWSAVDSFARAWLKQDPLRDPGKPPRFLSAFRGKQAGAGKKSLAFSLVYRAPDRTLTDEEVNTAHEKFQQALLKEFKATLRA
jgi:phenylalanyl-tRNA synthetase beta chain